MDPVIDAAHLAQFTAGDLALERELAELFVETAMRNLFRLGQALDDPAMWADAAHSLAGSSANMGAVAAATVARRAEFEPPSPEALAAMARHIAAVRAYFAARHPASTMLRVGGKTA